MNGPADPLVSILVPVYNEQDCLPDFLTRLGRVLENWDRRTEVVFVDDASSDGSVPLLARFCSGNPNRRLVRHAVNRGRGNAIWTAIDRSRGSIVVTLDADLENPPEAIPGLINGLGAQTACVTGFRQGRNRKEWRGMASWFYNRVMALLTGLPLHDCNCGLKALHRSRLRHPAVRSWLKRDGDYFRFIVLLLRRLGYRTTERAIPLEHRHRGKSRYHWKRYPKAALDLLCLLVTDFQPARPRRT
jgi:glycosyltransferase involved in cell wall biosynthesis